MISGTKIVIIAQLIASADEYILTLPMNISSLAVSVYVKLLPKYISVGGANREAWQV